MIQDAYLFFDWLVAAFIAIFNTIYVGFYYVFGFLGRICELLVAPLAAGGERVVAVMGWLFQSGISLVGVEVFRQLGIFFEHLMTWGWHQFGRLLGITLLWLDDFLPPTVTFDLAFLSLVVAYIKAATSWFNVGAFIATVTVGYTTIWTIALAKIVWRTIPTIG